MVAWIKLRYWTVLDSARPNLQPSNGHVQLFTEWLFDNHGTIYRLNSVKSQQQLNHYDCGMYAIANPITVVEAGLQFLLIAEKLSNVKSDAQFRLRCRGCVQGSFVHCMAIREGKSHYEKPQHHALPVPDPGGPSSQEPGKEKEDLREAQTAAGLKGVCIDILYPIISTNI